VCSALIALALLSLIPREVGLAQDNTDKTVEDVREAIFRFQFNRIGTKSDKLVRVYFLTIGESPQDPDETFISRFSDLKSSVRKASMALCSTNGTHIACRDRATGETGFLFWVGPVRVHSPFASAEGNFWLGTQAERMPRKYFLRFTNGRWTVQQEALDVHRQVPIEIFE